MKPSLPMLNLTDAFLFLTHLNLFNKYSLKVQYIIHTSLKCFLHNSGKPAESPALKGLSFQCGEREREENNKAKYTESKMTVSTNKEGRDTLPGQGYDFKCSGQLRPFSNRRLEVKI